MSANFQFSPSCQATLFSSSRVKIIPFERHFSEAEQDSTLKQVLAQSGNLSGILNWCLAGLRKIATDGFAMPQSVREATDDYRTNSDRLGRFLEDETEAGELFESSTNEVYARYQWWCARNGFRPDNIAVFKSSLENVATIKKQRPSGAGRGAGPGFELRFGDRKRERVAGCEIALGERVLSPTHPATPVSYTHLTLPTSDLV